jgi:hypothetical protein
MMRIKTKLWGLIFVVLVLSSWPGFSHAVVGKPMVVYSEEGQTAVKYSTYSSGAWATGATAADGASNEKYWKVAKTHPAGRKRATVFLQQNTTPRLYASLWDESNWDDGTGSAYGDAKDLGEISAYYRCFDAAYEQLSGKLMVVAATASNTISYWTWDAGTWSSASTYTFTNFMGTIYWIKIAAKPASNEITLIAAGSTLKANALVWSGSAWGNESNLTSSLTTNAQEAIGVEYMRGGSEMGKAVVFWATSSTMNAKVWSGSSWGSTVSKGSLSTSIRRLRVKADPNSNHIAVGYETSDSDIYVLIWSGTSWFSATNQIDLDAYGNYANHRPFDVIFEVDGGCKSTGGECMGDVLVVYADTTELRYRDCYLDSGGGAMTCNAEANVRNGSTTYQAYWVQLERAPANTIHLAIHDTNEDLVTWTWNNTSWTYENTISTNLESSHNYEGFALFPMPEARAILVWSDEGYAEIDYGRYHDGATSSVTVLQSGLTYAQYWKVLKTSADGSKQVALSADYRTTSLPHLLGTIYNGSSWTSITLGGAGDFGQIWSTTSSSNYIVRHRDFDAAFETSSGEILVVATNSSTTYQCNYWTYNGSWTGPSSLTFTNIGSGYSIKWVKLASNPNASSNEIALIVGADNGTTKKAVAQIWNGSSWGNEQSLSTALSANDQETIAVEYMQTGSNGGKALFAWAETNTIYGQVWNGSSYDSAQSRSVSVTNPIEWLRLAADTATDDLMLAYEDSTAYLYALKWTGAAWDSSATAISSDTLYGDDEYNRAFDVIWESSYGHLGHATIAYSLSSTLNYKHYDGSSWGSEGTVYGGQSFYWLQLARTTDNTIHLATHNGSDHLQTFIWDNSSWSNKNLITGIYLDRPLAGLEDGSLSSKYAQVYSITPVATTAPQIQAIDCNVGVVGAPITLYGVGFGNAQGTSTVTFYNNKPVVTVTSWSDVKIVVIVPSDTTSGYITVTRGSSSDTISFTLITGAPTITAILPDKGSNFSDIDIAYITGTNLSPGMTLTLKQGASEITATNVTLSSSTRIETATFDIKSAATGYWDVVITNPDTQTVTGTNLFAVVPPASITSGATVDSSSAAYPPQRHIVRDSAGTWYALFIGGTSIYITKSTDGATWDSPTAIFAYSGGLINTSTYATSMSVDIYRSGNSSTDKIHLVWRAYNGNTKYLHYSKCSNLSSYTLDTSWSQVDDQTSPRYDTIHTTTSGTSYYLQEPDIVVDSQGYPHVVWYYRYSSFEYIYYTTSRTGSGTPKDWGSWGTVAEDGDETGYTSLNYPVSIDVNSSDTVYVTWPMYVSATYTYGIRIGWSTNWTTWSTANRATPISTSNDDVYEASLIIDSGNKIYVAGKSNTNRDVYWGYYNGSSWSSSNDLTKAVYDAESVVLGAKMGSGITDHILLSKVYDASANKKVIYWWWDSTNSNWSKYSEELDTGNESRSYVSIERHAPASLKTMGYLFYDTSGDSLYFDRFTNLGSEPTVVELASFTATGNGKQVKVDWVTASEIDNLGFNLYRSTKKGGPYTKLNTSLIPGLLSSPTGKTYTYLDKNVRKAKLYYYKLEDIDLFGKKTIHGPICVDWNGDGIPDDQQLKNPSLSAGVSPRRPVLVNSRVKSPYDKGSRVIAAEMKSFTARQKDDHVLLQWRTAYEVNTLGYHVYREENGELLRLTPELVAGSALFAANALPAGNAYSWWDVLATESREESVVSGQSSVVTPQFLILSTQHSVPSTLLSALSTQLSALSTVQYWLEEVQLDGSQSWCGPVSPIPDESLKIPEYVASALLSKLGMNQSGQQSISSRATETSIQRLSTPGPIDLQWELANGPAVKLSVREQGWYRVTQPRLVAAGLDRKVNPRFLQLFVDGIEQPIRVRGESDGRFGRKDFIEFYGEGLDTLSTDARVYWLVPGAVPGKRISTIVTQPGPASAESSFPFTLELKERSLYFPALLNGEENNFFGPYVWAVYEPLERTLNVPYPDLSSSDNATLTVSLQGVTLKPHQVQVLLNEESVGEVVFEGQGHQQVTMTVPQSMLLEGENLITLVAEGEDLDVSLLDAVQLTYWRTFTADGNDLGFTLSSPGQVSINGFRKRSIRVADVTDPEAVTLVSGTRVSRGSPGYAVRFNPDPGSGTRTWLAFTKAGIKGPVEIKANQVSTWHDASQGADFVIISHADFLESLAPLKTFRESQGLSVALIDVEDIYDEFSYGVKTPQAIKDFLNRASTSWQTPPRFVLLVGDASFDPRDYLDLGNQDFLPTKFLDTAYMETASDDWFVDFNGDGLPDMAIGRLPVQTAEEATQVVTKIIAYDQAVAGPWATEALIVADQNSDFDFEGGSQEVADLLPEGMTVWSVDRGQVGDAEARTAILGSINEGKLIVNYMGHGAVDLWKGSVLTASDADSLTNESALPLVVGMTCLNGFFQTPYVETLAEALLKAENGGAVAVWTSSGLTDPAGQLQMNKGLVRLLFNGEGLTLGEATAGAKAATTDQDVRRSWILFGDPSTRLK